MLNRKIAVKGGVDVGVFYLVHTGRWLPGIFQCWGTDLCHRRSHRLQAQNKQSDSRNCKQFHMPKITLVIFISASIEHEHIIILRARTCYYDGQVTITRSLNNRRNCPVSPKHVRARLTKYFTTLLRLSYDNAEVTIDLRKAFLLVPAYSGCPGQTAVKWLLLLLRKAKGFS